jgi:hypothetical protein
LGAADRLGSDAPPESAIIGTGIFVLTGTAAANQAGSAITISYMAAGLACAFARSAQRNSPR